VECRDKILKPNTDLKALAVRLVEGASISQPAKYSLRYTATVG